MPDNNKRPDNEILNSEELIKRYKELLDFSQESIITYTNGIIVDCNKTVHEMFGYCPNELIGKTTETIWSETSTTKTSNCCGEGYSTAGLGVQKDGSTFSVEIKIQKIDNSKTKVASIKNISNCKNIENTLRERNKELVEKNEGLALMNQQLLASRKSFYQIAQGSDVNLDEQDLRSITTYGRWNFDLINDTLNWSPEIRDIVGGEDNEDSVPADTFRQRVHPDDREKVDKGIEIAVASKTLFKVEFRIGTRSKTEKIVLAQGIPQYNEKGEPFKVLGVLLDITFRSREELKLKRHRDHYLKLNEELIISRRQAEESEKMKTAFFSNMSHEIRTPMNGILGFSKLLLDPDTTEEERMEYSRIIATSGNRLLHIVNDILDISKLESDTVKIIKTDFKINNVLKDLYSLFSQNEKVANGKVKLEISTPLSDENSLINSDQNRLCQIITNLLSNALKFTETGTVKFGYKVLDKSLEFFVNDSGIGVPEDMKQRIFEPFRQVEGHLIKQHGGTGLGLSISRKLSQLLGGNLTMKSAEGSGSQFHFSLPFEAQEKPASLKPKTLNKSYRNHIKDVTLLIAEDDEVNFMFFRSFLGNRLTIIRATSGVEAIELTQKHPEIDVILMDVRMPVMNGIDAIKKIKETHPNIPIIAQTAYAMPEDKKEVFDAGADDYITKPINRRELLQKIQRFCVK